MRVVVAELADLEVTFGVQRSAFGVWRRSAFGVGVRRFRRKRRLQAVPDTWRQTGQRLAPSLTGAYHSSYVSYARFYALYVSYSNAFLSGNLSFKFSTGGPCQGLLCSKAGKGWSLRLRTPARPPEHQTPNAKRRTFTAEPLPDELDS